MRRFEIILGLLAVAVLLLLHSSSGWLRHTAADVAAAVHPPLATALPVEHAPAPVTTRPPAAPWPTIDQDTPDHLLARALAELRRQHPATYRGMRRAVPMWFLSLCDQTFCDPNMLGGSSAVGTNGCSSKLDVDGDVQLAQRGGVAPLPWLGVVLVADNSLCARVPDRGHAMASARAFIATWPDAASRRNALRLLQTVRVEDPRQG